MPPRQQTQSQYLDENHQRISEFADWMWDGEDEGDAREAFLTDAMSKKGYTARTRTDWEPPAPPEPDPKTSGRASGPGSYFKK